MSHVGGLGVEEDVIRLIVIVGLAIWVIRAFMAGLRQASHR